MRRFKAHLRIHHKKDLLTLIRATEEADAPLGVRTISSLWGARSDEEKLDCEMLYNMLILVLEGQPLQRVLALGERQDGAAAWRSLVDEKGRMSKNSLLTDYAGYDWHGHGGVLESVQGWTSLVVRLEDNGVSIPEEVLKITLCEVWIFWEDQIWRWSFVVA